MEVLISIFVLSIGLLGVAALIPLGQMALWETAKADRCGACGRAALREIQVGRMLDFRYWYWTPSTLPNPAFPGNYWGFPPPYKISTTIHDDFSSVNTCTDSMPFVIDPLGRAKGLPETFGPHPTLPTSLFLTRRSLRSIPLMPSQVSPPPAMLPALAEQIFYWNDDLPFDAPKNSAIRPKLVSTTSEGSYSWFFTVMPAASEMTLPVSARRLFNVSVVVCYKRNFQIYDPNRLYPNSPTTYTLDGEHTATISLYTGFRGMGIGGGTVQLDPGSNVNVKENQWVMLYYLHVDDAGNPFHPAPAFSPPEYPLMNRCHWYRVVGVGQSTDTNGNPATYINLSGPDWDLCGDAWKPTPGGSPALAVMVVVPGVIGVYNATMELDWDPLWTK
jgi:hypothetical protein